MELKDILKELVFNGKRDASLAGGLKFQFKADNGLARLCCYRVGIEPSDVEMNTVRRDLQALLPDRIIRAGKSFRHVSGRQEKYCRVLMWAEISQLGFGGAVETAVTNRAQYE